MRPPSPALLASLAPLALVLAGCSTTATPSSAPAVATTAPASQTPPSTARIYDVSQLSQLPAPVFQARPQYPAKLREDRVPGDALVDFIVDVNGEVRNAQAMRATHPEFGVAAVIAVQKWRFKPGVYQGRIVPTHMQVPIVFTLDELSAAAPVDLEAAFTPPATPPPADTFAIAHVDVKPSPRFQARPIYPVHLRRAGVQGEAVVDFIVDTSGNVIRAYALRATQPEFGQAAVGAVAQWRFTPGKKGGRVVNTHLQVPIVFTIN